MADDDSTSFARIETRPYDDENAERRGDDNSSSSGSTGSRPITPTTPSGAKPPRPGRRASSASSRGKEGNAKGTRAISVIARFRPENALELEKGGLDCCRYDPDGQRVSVSMSGKGAGQETHDFKFERVLPPSTTQAELYAHCGRPVVEAIFEGINASVLFFGATGSGKTYSSIGAVNEQGIMVAEPGVLPRLLNDVFEKIDSMEDTHDCVFNFSMVELYMERLRDLLSFLPLGRNRIHGDKKKNKRTSVVAKQAGDNNNNNNNAGDDNADDDALLPGEITPVPSSPASPGGTTSKRANDDDDAPPIPKDISTAIRTDSGPPPGAVERWRKMCAFGGTSGFADNLEIRDAGDKNLYVSNCTSIWCQNAQDSLACVQRGLQYRTTAATKQNQNSSRSHCILVCTLIVKDRTTLVTTRSQLYVVDLAGSERVSKSETEGLLLDEAKSINLSLFSLGSVITALAEKASKRGESGRHVPYRDSKLTRLLENSLGGNALTYIMCACSPNSYNAGETISTLTFGAKSSLVKTQPRRNENITVEELQLLLDNAKSEIEMQKAQIQMLKMQLVRKSDSTNSNSNNNNKNNNNNNSPGIAKPGTRLFEIASERHERLIDIVKGLLVDPLTGQKMKDPVFCLDGNTYERASIFQHLVKNEMMSPLTGQRVLMSTLTPNSMIKALDAMCRDEDLLVGNPQDVDRYQTPFMAWAPVFLIVSYLSLDQRLSLATLNSQFARCVYDKDMWFEPVNELLKAAPESVRQHVKSANLPAHKVYTLLKRHAANPGRISEQLQRYIIRSDQPIALFSSKIQKESERFKKDKNRWSSRPLGGNEPQYD